MNKVNSHPLSLTYQQYKKGGESIANSRIDKYVIYEQIGRGSFGAVYKGMNDDTKNIVAVKVLDLQAVERDPSEKVKQIRRRLCESQSRIMMICDSQNLLKCFDVYENKSLKIMIIEYCGGGTLQEEIDDKGKISEAESIIIIKQIINGIAELHKHKIIHRDLKAENILIHNGVYKIADFGFSKQINSEQSALKQTTLGTITTMAPEVMRRQAYGLKADIWSVGVIFFQMIYGKVPYTSTSANQMYNEIKSKKILQTQKFEYNGHVASKEVTQFIKEILVIEPEKRLGWKQLVVHPLFVNKNQKLVNQFRINVNLKAPENSEKQEFYLPENHLNLFNLSPQNNYIKPEQLIRLSSQQAQSKKQQMNTYEDELYKWVKNNHLECLKTELIYIEIVEKIEKNQMLDLDNRDVIELIYLLLTRCYSNISCIKSKMIKQNNQLIIEKLIETVQNLYDKVQKSWKKYGKILTDVESKLSNIITDKFAKIFKTESMNQKDKYLTGIEGIQYSKQQQIEFTERMYIGVLKDQLKTTHVKDGSRVKDYLRHYREINEIKQDKLKQRNFREYVDAIIK